MNMRQVTERAHELESAIRGLKHTKFLAGDDSGLKDSEKYILWMLATLNEGRPVRPSEAAKKLNVTLAAVTHLINSLEERELVTRAASPDDRRMVFISLSTKGAAMADALKKSYWKKVCGLVEHLGVRDSGELIALMNKISAYVKDAGNA